MIVPARAGGKALGAKTDRDIGKHQPVAHRDQRHGQDDAGNCDERRGCFHAAGRVLIGCCLGHGRHIRLRLPVCRGAGSGKSDIV